MKFKIQGSNEWQEFSGVSADEIIIAMGLGNEDGSMPDYQLKPSTVQERKNIIRSVITEKAGDIHSLLATTSDTTQIILFAFSQITVALNKANSLADVRKAAEPFADLAASFLAKLESGQVKLPFQAKGFEKVVGDIETRATAVTEVLAEVLDRNNA